MPAPNILPDTFRARGLSAMTMVATCGNQLAPTGRFPPQSGLPIGRPHPSQDFLLPVAPRWRAVGRETVPATALLPRLGSRQGLAICGRSQEATGPPVDEPRRLPDLWRRPSSGADLTKAHNGLRLRPLPPSKCEALIVVRGGPASGQCCIDAAAARGL